MLFSITLGRREHHSLGDMCVLRRDVRSELYIGLLLMPGRHGAPADIEIGPMRTNWNSALSDLIFRMPFMATIGATVMYFSAKPPVPPPNERELP
jgi:hypothetical protein